MIWTATCMRPALGVRARVTWEAGVNEWIVRVMPLQTRDPFPVVDPLNTELARFRIRIIGPHDRPGLHAHGPRVGVFDIGAIRILALDSANPFGGVGGSFDSDQCAWLVRELGSAGERYVMLASHDGSRTLTSTTAPDGTAPRVLGPEVVSILLAQRNVIGWLSGTTHERSGRRHGSVAHGFWEIPAAAVGLGAPLAGGISVSRQVRHLHSAIVMRGALSGESGPTWEVPDPRAEAAVSAEPLVSSRRYGAPGQSRG